MRFRQYDALGLTAGLWFLGKFLRYAFPPLFLAIGAEYGVGNTVIGSAYGAMMIAYASMQFPSGALSDRLGPTTVITAGAVVAAAGALTVVVPGPLPLLVGGMVLVGLGTGAHKTVAVPMLSNIYRRRPGRALGVMDTLGALAGVVAPPLALLFLDTAGWRYTFALGGAAGVTLAAAFRLRVPERLPDHGAADDATTEDGGDEADDDGTAADGAGPTDADASEGASAYRALLADRTLTVVVVAAVLASFAFNGFVAFLPAYLTESVGLSTGLAGTIYSGFFLVSLVQLGTGEVGDRIGMLPVLSGALALGAVGLAGLLVAGTTLAIVAAVLAFGLGMHGHRPVRGAYFAALLPETGGGGAFGVIRTALIGAGAVAPAITGYLTEALGYRPAFTVLAVAMVVAAALAGSLLAGGRLRRAVAG
jgi:MFS family permease